MTTTRRRPGPAARLDLASLLADTSVTTLVCCGSGGVGKTTTAAALALTAAETYGRRVVVLTIDPARRLAQALGLDQLGNSPTPVAGIDTGRGGSLDAMMLDMRRTFDELLESHTRAEQAQAIKENPVYEAVSTSLSGTQEYMAMEKLAQLRAAVAAGERDWDLIVVDTPPSRSALDFLDAPSRMGSFLDGRFVRMLSVPAHIGGRLGRRVFDATLGNTTSIVSKILGVRMLADVQAFVASADTLFGGFRARAEATYATLQSPETAFLVVATPERDALREASYFASRLGERRMPLAGMVLSRTQPDHGASISSARAEAALETLMDRDDADRHEVVMGLLEIRSDQARLADHQSAELARFTARHPQLPIARVAGRSRSIGDLAALRSIGTELAAAPANRGGRQ